MDIQVESQGPLCRVNVSGPLDIYAVREFRDRMGEWLRAATEVELRLSDVSELDTACLQVMIAAKREAAAQRKTLRFSEHSGAVLATLELSRLVSVFGDPVVLSERAEKGDAK